MSRSSARWETGYPRWAALLPRAGHRATLRVRSALPRVTFCGHRGDGRGAVRNMKRPGRYGPGQGGPHVRQGEVHMHRGWRAAVVAAALGVGGAASAHEFRCEKHVDGQPVAHIDEYPVTVR